MFSLNTQVMYSYKDLQMDPFRTLQGAAVVEWLSSWLAEQEVRGSIAGVTLKTGPIEK